MSGSAAIAQNIEQDDCRGRELNTAYSVVVDPVLQLLPDEEDSVIVHEQEWVRPQDSEDVMPLNGAVSPREWFIRTPTGEMLRPDGDRGLRSPLDYFLLMMPPSQLSEMTRLTNIQLRKSCSQKVATTQGELLRFIGVLLLSTRFEFGSRASLWSPIGSKYIPADSFGKTGMARRRFDTLWSCLTFSKQPVTRPQEMSSERYRWIGWTTSCTSSTNIGGCTFLQVTEYV
jgi:Transposase IS4